MKKVVFLSQPISSRLPKLKKNEHDFYNFLLNFSSEYTGKIILCLHPEEKKNISFLKKNLKKKKISIRIGTKKISYTKNDIFVGMFSTELIRACMLQKKVINYHLNNEISRNFILNKLRLCYEVRDYKEMLKLISSNKLKVKSKFVLKKKFGFLKNSVSRLNSVLV